MLSLLLLVIPDPYVPTTLYQYHDSNLQDIEVSLECTLY